MVSDSTTSTPLIDYIHPILGAFRRRKSANAHGQSFITLEKADPTEVSGVGYVFELLSIFYEGQGHPPDSMLEDLVDIVRWPLERKGEIEEKMFSYYEAHRKEWLDDPEGLVESLEIIRSIKRPSDVWKLIVRPLYINAGTWPEASIAFECVFDIEHELHISFADGAVSEVWTE